jgi:hypothetical protein
MSELNDDFPEPLFETSLEGKRLCLVCARKHASRALWTVRRPVVPLCDDCRADWNLYGYLILKKIKPASLISNILKFKLHHPFQSPSLLTVWRDVRRFQEWAQKMKKYSDDSKS